jgi:hypothetical protein
MELKYYLDKAIDEYLGKLGTITTKKIMNYVYSEYNLDVNREEISKILKERTGILEIVEGIFVDKKSFISFMEETDASLLKSQIEFQYLISIKEEQIAKIEGIIKLHKNQELQLEEGQDINKREKWTYSKIIDFGMENGYIKSSWVQDIEYIFEKEVHDYFEAIEDVKEKGIEIKYDI